MAPRGSGHAGAGAHGRASRVLRPLRGPQPAPRMRFTDPTAVRRTAAGSTDALHGSYGRYADRSRLHGRASRIPRPFGGPQAVPRTRATDATAAPRTAAGPRTRFTGPTAASRTAAGPTDARHKIRGRSVDRSQSHGRAPRTPRPFGGPQPAPRTRFTDPTAVRRTAAGSTDALHGSYGRFADRSRPHGRAPQNPRPFGGPQPVPRTRSTDATAVRRTAAGSTDALHGSHGRSADRSRLHGRASRVLRPLRGPQPAPRTRSTKSAAVPRTAANPTDAFSRAAAARFPSTCETAVRSPGRGRGRTSPPAAARARPPGPAGPCRATPS